MLTDIATPLPGPGQVGIAIRACGLNFADLLMMKGSYQETPPAPFTLGMEAAGIVETIGDGVRGFAPGDRVAVFAGHGGLAETGVFDAARIVAVPDAMSFEHAAAFQIAHGTAHIALTRPAPGCARARRYWSPAPPAVSG